MDIFLTFAVTFQVQVQKCVASSSQVPLTHQNRLVIISAAAKEMITRMKVFDEIVLTFFASVEHLRLTY